MDQKKPLIADDWSRLIVEVSSNVIFQDLDGEMVLLEMKTGQYFGLDELSTRIWQLLTTGSTLLDVADVLMKEYDVDQTRCLKDMTAFILKLEKKHLLVVRAADTMGG